ncbi:MAG: glutamate racemase [Bacteroidia bacterium]|jgi:glutamate racemase|nr:glutamate racemase [Bacteroidia bacterium]
MLTQGPIGVFDSGYGGLTILKEFKNILPQYDFLYLGDNARAPYGTRSFDTVYEYTLQAVKYLFEQNCSLVILACNTASAKALRTIQQNDLPKISNSKRVLGVIRPTTEIVGEVTTTKHIGVLGTKGTVMSNSYVVEIEKLHPELQVFQHACPMWVPLVENNEYLSPGADYFVKKDLDALLNQSSNIDTIILGCTHYPLLMEKIQQFLPPNINILSQGEVVAKSLKSYLNRHSNINQSTTKNSRTVYLTTDSSESFAIQAKIFMGETIDARQIHLK